MFMIASHEMYVAYSVVIIIINIKKWYDIWIIIFNFLKKERCKNTSIATTHLDEMFILFFNDNVLRRSLFCDFLIFYSKIINNYFTQLYVAYSTLKQFCFTWLLSCTIVLFHKILCLFFYLTREGRQANWFVCARFWFVLSIHK